MNSDPGFFVRLFTYLFGANWKTSLSGFVAIIAYFIHGHPQYLHWISEPFQGFIWQGSEYIFYGGLAKLAQQVKDKNVTGGIKQQTTSGATAEPGTQSLVDQTVIATIKSGEAVTPEQKKAAQS